MSTLVPQGAYGPVVLDGELVEYDDDGWYCVCGENRCERSTDLRADASPRRALRINLLTARTCSAAAPCPACGCCDGAYCHFTDDGCELRPLDQLEPAGELGRKLLRLPAGACVYLVQMMPDLAPKRLKVGFSTDLVSRLKSYRTACPTAQVIATRAGSRSLEDFLLHAFRRRFLSPGGEVFEVDDVEVALLLFMEVAG